MTDVQTSFEWGPGIETGNLYNNDEGEEHKKNANDTNSLEKICIE